MTTFRTSRGKLEQDGSNSVTLQDQNTPLLISKFSKLEASTTTTADAVYDSNQLILADASGIDIASGIDYITIFDPSGDRVSFFRALSVATNTVTLDALIDFEYPSGSYVDISTTNLAVDGSVTPARFGVRNNYNISSPVEIPSAVDITRLHIVCTSTSPMDLESFADISALTNGLLLRSRNGQTYNKFNIKSNKELANIVCNFEITEATNPSQGVDGFIARISFAGQSNMGAVIRLEAYDDLEIYVQDDLSAITSIEVVVEGSFVEE